MTCPAPAVQVTPPLCPAPLCSPLMRTWTGIPGTHLVLCLVMAWPEDLSPPLPLDTCLSKCPALLWAQLTVGTARPCTAHRDVARAPPHRPPEPVISRYMKKAQRE